MREFSLQASWRSILISFHEVTIRWQNQDLVQRISGQVLGQLDDDQVRIYERQVIHHRHAATITIIVHLTWSSPAVPLVAAGPLPPPGHQPLPMHNTGGDLLETCFLDFVRHPPRCISRRHK